MAKKKQEESNEPQPNVTFHGASKDASVKGVKEGEDGFVPREPIKSFTNGSTIHKLPPVDEQLAGPFYFADAQTLVRLYPRLYKFHVEKGAK